MNSETLMIFQKTNNLVKTYYKMIIKVLNNSNSKNNHLINENVFLVIEKNKYYYNIVNNYQNPLTSSFFNKTYACSSGN